MRVLVTGGAGFVGSHVARLLVTSGHEVHALLLGDDAEEERARERFGTEDTSIARVRGDLLAPASFAKALEALRPEACVHLGWYAAPKDYLSSRVNVDFLSASAALCEKLVDLGCRRIVAAGTCFEYDTSIGYLAESSPLAPRHLYSACKRALFDVMTQLVAPSRTSFAWARLFFLYGPHERRGRLVPEVIETLMAGEEARVTTGEQIRDYLHVADAASAIVHVLEREALTGAVNVASGRPVAVREMVATIAGILGKEDRVAWGAVAARPNDPPFVCANVDKLRASGFSPKLDLEAGLRDTVAWRTKARAASDRARGVEG